MIKFGYSINIDSQIDYDMLNRGLAKQIESLEPTFNQCINCGTCSATCTAAQHTDYNFRKLTLMIRRGLVEGVENQIAKCMLCAKCRLQCPRGVNTRSVVIAIRKTLKK